MLTTPITRGQVSLDQILKVRAKYVQAKSRDGQRYADSTLRWLVAHRDGYVCEWCGSTIGLHMDHVVPWSAGGPTRSRNLRWLCADCNVKRGTFVDLSDERTRLDCVWNCQDCTPGLAELAGTQLEFVYCATCTHESYSHPDLIDQSRLDSRTTAAIAAFVQENW